MFNSWKRGKLSSNLVFQQLSCVYDFQSYVSSHMIQRSIQNSSIKSDHESVVDKINCNKCSILFMYSLCMPKFVIEFDHVTGNILITRTRRSDLVA